MGQKVTQKYGHSPKNGDQCPGLGSICRSLCQEGQVEDVETCETKDESKITKPPFSHFYHSQEGKKVERCIQEESIPLVQEVAEEGFPTVAEGNVHKK